MLGGQVEILKEIVFPPFSGAQLTLPDSAKSTGTALEPTLRR